VAELRADGRGRGSRAGLALRLAVKDAGGALAGFFSFRGSPGLCTIGLGLAPRLTGRSLGPGFVRTGLDFAVSQWRVSRFRLEVVAFNVRAVRVYKRLGFVSTGSYVCFPAGQRAGHALVNHSDDTVRYLIIGERNPSEVTVHTDTGRVGVRLLGEGYRMVDTVDYWDGEDD
jgi:RimJ/RimL family protein N-acetyltransferase